MEVFKKVFFKDLPFSHRGETPAPPAPKTPETDDAQIIAFVSTLLSPASVTRLRAAVTGDERAALFAELNTEIETAGRQRWGETVAREYGAEQNRGVWSRAEKTAMSTWAKFGVTAQEIEDGIGDIGDKGRYAKIMEVGAGLAEAKHKAKFDGLKGADMPRLKQMQEEIAAHVATITSMKTAAETMQAEHVAALAERDNMHAVNGHRDSVLNAMYAKNAAKKIVLDRAAFSEVAEARLAARKLSVKKEGDKFLLFNEDGTAAQIPGTQRNYTLNEFYDEVATPFVHVSNAKPSNGKPSHGVVLGDASKPDLKNIHENARGDGKRDRYAF